MKLLKNENIKYLNEGEKCGAKCPDCDSSSFQFLPDVKSVKKKYGRFKTYEWRCFDCETLFVQTEESATNQFRNS